MNHLSDGLTNVIRRIHEVAAVTGPRPVEEKKEVCSHCKGAGFLRRDLPPNDPNFGRAVVCRCTTDKLKTRRQERLVKLSNLGMLSRFTFDTFSLDDKTMNAQQVQNRQKALDICRQYAEKPEGWLVLKGGYGGGKTHLAAGIANERISKGELTLFVVVPDLLDYLRATYGPNSQVGYDQRFNQVRNMPLLILDNFGTQASTPWAQEKLFQIINYRYNGQLPTVITTNVPLDEIDLRIRSRLLDPRISQVLTVDAQDSHSNEGGTQSSDLSILPLLGHMNFDSFNQSPLGMDEAQQEGLEQAYNASYQFAKEPSGWLVLVGDYGVGKTHLAAAIANIQHSRGNQALFIVVPDLLDHLRATYSPQSTVSYDERFVQIRRAPLLVLDDLGTHSSTRWAQEKLFQLFNYRHMARLPTVITLHSVRQIDPRLYERMMEMIEVGSGGLVQIPVPAYRTRLSNKKQNTDMQMRGSRHSL